jgi:hypothetical protein
MLDCLYHIGLDLLAGINSDTAALITCVQISLAKEMPKTRERKNIYTSDNRVYVDALEARNHAAVHALYRVNFDKVCLCLQPTVIKHYASLHVPLAASFSLSFARYVCDV